MSEKVSADIQQPIVLLITADSHEAHVAKKAREMAEALPLTLVERRIPPEQILKSPAAIVQELDTLGAQVWIAAAGVLSQLPAILAAHTPLPVLSVPVRTELMNGMDTLMAAIRTPAAACAPASAIDGGENAVLLAAEILALKYDGLAQALTAYRASMKEHVRQQNEQLKQEMEYRG